MGRDALDDRAEEEFARLFGTLQRSIGTAIEVFYGAVDTGVKPDVWMDDTRMMFILQITTQDARLEHQATEPATWVQRFKQDKFPAWLLRLFPVQRSPRPCKHAPWEGFAGDVRRGWVSNIRDRLALPTHRHSTIGEA